MGKRRERFIVIAAAVLATTGWTALVSRDTAAPAVSWVTPSQSDVGVELDAAITVTFSEDVDSTTIGADSVRLATNDVPVEASVSFDKLTRSALLTPKAPLTSATKYVATLNAGVRDHTGNTLTTSQSWSFTTRCDLEHGVGGPILIVHSGTLPFSKYYSEILRAEGIGSFESVDLSQVSKQLLDRFSLVLLGEMPLSKAQAAMFSRWVDTGGDLITMRPDKKLSGLLVCRTKMHP